MWRPSFCWQLCSSAIAMASTISKVNQNVKWYQSTSTSKSTLNRVVIGAWTETLHRRQVTGGKPCNVPVTNSRYYNVYYIRDYWISAPWTHIQNQSWLFVVEAKRKDKSVAESVNSWNASRFALIVLAYPLCTCWSLCADWTATLCKHLLQNIECCNRFEAREASNKRDYVL